MEEPGRQDAGPEDEGGAERVAAGVAMDRIECELQAGGHGAEHGQCLHDQNVMLRRVREVQCLIDFASGSRRTSLWRRYIFMRV